MKRKHFLLASIILAALLVSCSPSQRGKSLGDKYCSELMHFTDSASYSSLRSYRDSIDNLFAPQLEALKQKYADNIIKQTEAMNAYKAAVNSGSTIFTAAYEGAIRNNFSKNVWYRHKDPSNYFLYSLANDTLNVLNCKEKVAYRLSMDTIFFDDKDSTVALLNIVGDTALVLVDAYNPERESNYRIAEFEEMIRGTWNFRSMKNALGKTRTSYITYKEGGKYSGEEWQSRGWTYYYLKVSGKYAFKQVNDSTYNLISDGGKNGVNGKMVVKDADTFRHYYSSGGSEVKRRSKKGTLKPLAFLFEEKKEGKK